MLRQVVSLVLCVLMAICSFAQETGTNASPANSSVTHGSNSSSLLDGTPIRLRLTRNVSSADATTGESVDFEVLDDVKVGDLLVIRKGGVAIGTVTDAQPKRRMSRGGKLDMTIDYVRLVDGGKATLRAVREAKGGGHTGAMTAGIVATSLIVWPAAPFFLFMKGKDITIPKGTEITAYVDGDVAVDRARIETALSGSQSNTVSGKMAASGPVAPVTTASATTAKTGIESPASESASASGAEADTVTSTSATAAGPAERIRAEATATPGATLNVSSTPVGADVEIDGAFVGTTPSSVGVDSGDHLVKITKSGFKSWERKLKVTTGNIQLAPELEKEIPDSTQAK